MNKLSQEILDMIVGHVQFGPIAQLLAGHAWEEPTIPYWHYATVSRPWQKAVERLTFRAIKIRDLDEATRILGGSGGRWRFVRHIDYVYCAKPPADREDPREVPFSQMFEDEAVTVCSLDFLYRMRRFLSFVNANWPSHANLSVLVSCDIEDNFNPSDPLLNCPVTRPRSHWKLPFTPVIREFKVYRPYENCFYRLHHSWLPKIQAAMPQLTAIGWELDAEEHILEMNHGDIPGVTPSDTLKGITGVLAKTMDMSNLQVLDLKLRDYDCTFGQWPMTLPENSAGLLTIYKTLRKISLRLREFHIDGYFLLPPDLFWPSKADLADGQEEPFWPHMEDFTVCFSGPGYSYPNGEMFFDWTEEPDPAQLQDEDEDDDGSEPLDKLASVPTEFNKLIIAASRAMLRMPKLESFIFTTEDEPMERLSNIISKTGPGRGLDLPLYYNKEEALGPNAKDDEYLPMAGFGRLVGWEPPAEVLENWAHLRKMLVAGQQDHDASANTPV